MSTATPRSSAAPLELLTLGLLANSSMENERRLPIHPHHFDRIDADIRARMIVERGYGADFRLAPDYIESRVGRVADRSEVLASAVCCCCPSHSRPTWQRSPPGGRSGGGRTAYRMPR